VQRWQVTHSMTHSKTDQTITLLWGKRVVQNIHHHSKVWGLH